MFDNRCNFVDNYVPIDNLENIDAGNNKNSE